MKISVVVPVYNAEKYLAECVDSILNQTYKDIELILVDDGSSDGCPKICDNYAKTDERVKVIHKSNGGVSSARQIGIENISGDYVLFVDSDDWLDLDTVKICCEQVCKYPEIGCVMFSYCREFPDKTLCNHVFDGDRSFLENEEFKTKVYRRLFGLNNSELNHPERLENLTTCWMKLYRADLAKQGKFIDINEIGSCEDGIYNIYALRNCKSAVYLDKPLYHYRKLDTSLSNGYRQELPRQWNKLFGIFQNFIDENNLAEFQEAFNNRISLSIIGIGLNELTNPEKRDISFAKYMKNYIEGRQYRNAVSTLDLKALPIDWKVLLFCCKHRLSFLLAIILKLIKLIK